MKFKDTTLSDNLKRAIEEIGYEDLTSIQESTFKPITEGKDIVAISNTGSGKTAAFMLPIINSIDNQNKNTEVLVITPTRELACQIVDETRKYCKHLHGINTIAVYGGQDIKTQAILLRKGVKIVVGTPGRLLDLLKKKVAKIGNLKVLVLDESDEMLSMGFEKEINGILSYVNTNVQKLLFSATITDRVNMIVKKILNRPQFIECRQNNTMLVDTVRQKAIEVKEKMKAECTLRILKKENAQNSIIFCNTKKKTEQIADFLRSNEVKVEVLNSDIRQEQREKILKKLKQGLLDTIVVTDVLARGIDIEDLDLVINYDIPLENEYYVHRIGRTARKGKNGIAYTLYTGKQIKRIEEIEKYTNTKIDLEDVIIKENENVDVSLPMSSNGLYIVKLNVGKISGIKAKDIVGAFGALVGLKSEKIGKIEVKEDETIVEVPKEYILDVIRVFSSGEIKSIPVSIVK